MQTQPASKDDHPPDESPPSHSDAVLIMWRTGSVIALLLIVLFLLAYLFTR